MAQRLVDADKLIEKGRLMEELGIDGIPYEVKAVSVTAIEDAPTVDAVPVVRCKECRYYGKYGVCNFHSDDADAYHTGHDVHMDYDDFCSYGERRSEDA